MKTINDEWESYLNEVLPPDADEVQVQETWLAFRAGAISLVNLIAAHSRADGKKIVDHLISDTKNFVAYSKKRRQA